MHFAQHGKLPGSEFSTQAVIFAGGHTPDTPTDPEGATPSRPPAQAAAGSQSPGVKTATEGQTAADQLIANASWTADHAQAPSISPPPDDAGATDRLEADKLAAAEGLVAGQIAASDMLAVGQLQPAASLQVDQADGKAPPVILTLCGMPGSGKSTFSAALIAQGRSSWVRVNQDSIKNGRQAWSDQRKSVHCCLWGHCCYFTSEEK